MKPFNAPRFGGSLTLQGEAAGRAKTICALSMLAVCFAGLSACESPSAEVAEAVATAPVVSDTAAGDDPGASAPDEDGLGVFDLAAQEEIQPGNAASEADKLERELLQDLTRLGLTSPAVDDDRAAPTKSTRP